MSDINDLNIVEVYSDGSFTSGDSFATWGFLIIKNGKILHKQKGIITDPIILEGWQVGAELQAVIQGVEFCKTNNYKGKFYVDFTGCINWIKDLIGKGKPWKTKKEYTKAYRDYIKENKDYIFDMVWVKGHSDNLFNNEIDEFIK